MPIRSNDDKPKHTHNENIILNSIFKGTNSNFSLMANCNTIIHHLLEAYIITYTVF